MSQDLELYGPWIGEVVENEDPDKEGKIAVRIPELCGRETVYDVRPWFPCDTMHIPQIGQFTKITFRHLNRAFPMWEGAWWPTSKRPPEMNGEPKRHVLQIVNQNNERLWTIMLDETGNKATIRKDKDGSYIEFDGNTREINVWTDKTGVPGAENVQNKSSINLNGVPHISARQVARKFDKVLTLDAYTGKPIDGLIMEGTERVFASKDKLSIV